MKTNLVKNLSALAVVFIWGINPAIAKLGMLEIPPFWFLTIRYALTALIFLPFAKVRRQDWKIIIVYALFANVLCNGAQFVAFQILSPTASTLMLMTETPITVFMAWFFCNEKISVSAVVGIVLSLIGVTVILGLPAINIGGALLILVTRIAWGYCQLLFKSSSQLQAAAFAGFSALIAMPFTLGAALTAESEGLTLLKQADWRLQIWILLFQAVMISLASVGWQKLIARFGVSQISPFAVLQIVFGILGGVILFHDQFNTQTIAGILLISSGVILSARQIKTPCNREN